MSLPPDRGHITTEQPNVETQGLDVLSTHECVELLASDHLQAIDAVQHAAPSIAFFIDAVHQRVADGGRLIYIGSGTSGRLGVLDAAECPPTFQSDPDLIIGLIAGGDSALRKSSEGSEDDPEGARHALRELSLNAKDTVVGIAAGGTTPWVIGGLHFSKEQGAMTCLLTCSDVEGGFDHSIVLKTGPEPLTGSTRLKAGTATKLTLNIITTTLFTKLGKVYGNMMVDLRATNNKLQDRAIRIVCDVCQLNRDAAAGLLEQSESNVKLAIIMHTCNTDCESAKQKLEDAGGMLRTAL
jgi:N-acetylmuramic acid 6-phosphate etherase